MSNRQNTFLLKRSNVPGKIPLPGDLKLGEIALNTSDVILYASGTTTNTILPIGWDRISRTGDTVTGNYNINGNISGTTFYGNGSNLSGLFNPIISGTTGGDQLEYNSTTSLWENSHPYWTIDLMDASSVEFYTSRDTKINSITNIVASPTITIADDGAPYTLGNTILSGSKVTVTTNTPTVIKLNIEL